MASFSLAIFWELLCNNTGQDPSGSEPSHCDRPVLWWEMLSAIPFAAALIYVANTPFSIPYAKLSLLAVFQALPLYSPSLFPWCILLSRLSSWSAVLNRFCILQSLLTYFPILFSMPSSTFYYLYSFFTSIFLNAAFLSCWLFKFTLLRYMLLQSISIFTWSATDFTT